MAGPGEKSVDGWGAGDALCPSTAFELRGEDDGREITLTFDAAPLAFPDEHEPKLSDGEAPATNAAPHPPDAWTIDRITRSNLPVMPSDKEPSPMPTRAIAEPLLDELEGDALALIARAAPAQPALDLVSEMAERFALHDFTGSLRAAELLLGQTLNASLARGTARFDPALAQHYARESRQKLELLYTSRVTAGGRVPVLAMPEDEIRWLGLDSHMTLLLSRIDGVSDYEQILAAVSGPRLAVLQALLALIEARVVRLV